MLESSKDSKAARAASWRRWPTARKREREAAVKEEKVRRSEAAAIDNAPPISYWTLWRFEPSPLRTPFLLCVWHVAHAESAIIMTSGSSCSLEAPNFQLPSKRSCMAQGRRQA